jgi:hypothetical protein
VLGRNRSKQASTLAKLIKPIDSELRKALSRGRSANQPELDECSESMAARALTTVVDSIAENWKKPCVSMALEECRKRVRKESQFESRLHQVWGPTFRALRTLQIISYEMGAELNALSTPTTTPLRYVLLHLHARACKVFSEVCLLLEHGYADGAHARWRSLHETAVVAMILVQHGDRAAMLYLEHEAIESYKAACEYERHAPSLGYEPIDDATLMALRKEHDALVSKHGAPFRTPYGWAAELLKNPRPGFDALELAAKLDHRRPFYRMASHAVHANPKSFQFSLAQTDFPHRVRLAGPSNAGLADPAHDAAISLAQVCAALLQGVETVDALALMKLIGNLTDKIGDEAIAAHRHVESLAKRDRSRESPHRSRTQTKPTPAPNKVP